MCANICKGSITFSEIAKINICYKSMHAYNITKISVLLKQLGLIYCNAT